MLTIIIIVKNADDSIDVLFSSGLLKKCLCLMPRRVHPNHATDPTKSFLPTRMGCYGSPLIKNKDQRTALHIAARYGQTECAKILIQNGAVVDGLDKDGKSPLQLAAWKNHCGVMKELVKSRANTNVITSNTEKSNLKACAPGNDIHISLAILMRFRDIE